jgi:hypothetical protein
LPQADSVERCQVLDANFSSLSFQQLAFILGPIASAAQVLRRATMAMAGTAGTTASQAGRKDIISLQQLHGKLVLYYRDQCFRGDHTGAVRSG